MKERGDNTIVINVEKTDNVIAYCSDCRSLVFHGNDETPLKRKVLKNRVVEHLDQSTIDHEVDVIYPRKSEKERIIAGKTFVSVPKYILEAPRSGIFRRN
jgi:hypothetical protein